MEGLDVEGTGFVGWWCGPGCTHRIAALSEQKRTDVHVHLGCAKGDEMTWVPVSVEKRPGGVVAVFPDGRAIRWFVSADGDGEV
jgi:hypothetical protein